jgi:penicillin-binding protein 1A
MSMRDAQGRGITGGRGAAPIWVDFMRRATEGAPRREFVVPADIRFLQLNSTTGQPAVPWGPRGMEVALRGGQMEAVAPAFDGREPRATGGGQ